jgi:ABC-2 type transport system ATP-binding protein
VIEARDLRRTFTVRPQTSAWWPGWLSPGRTVEAVSSLSFRIEPGEFVGIVGPNGAGKSTTLKMLTGVLVPTSGALTVAGVAPHRQRTALARRIGVVFGQRTQLWWDLSPGVGYALLRRIYQVPEARHRRLLGELTERLTLGPLLDVPLRHLSLGQKMRCELAAALLHEPPLLLLDEPTIGLDVVVKDEIQAFLRELGQRGTTVLLTSHDLDDIETLCRRVMVIDRGLLLHDGSLESLRHRYGQRRRLTLHLREAREAQPLPPHTQLLEEDGRRLVLEVEGAVPPVVRYFLDSHEVMDMAVSEVGIEDVIKRLYRGDR